MKAKLQDRFPNSDVNNSDMNSEDCSYLRPPKKQKTTTTSFSVFQIPINNWGIICEYLTFEDLKSLRLTSHWFRNEVITYPHWNPWISYLNLELYEKHYTQFYMNHKNFNGNGNKPSNSPVRQLYFPSILSEFHAVPIPSFIQIIDFSEWNIFKEDMVSLIPSLKKIIFPYWTNEIREKYLIYFLSNFSNTQIEFKDKFGTYSLLYWCCSKGYISVIRYLLEVNSRELDTLNKTYYLSNETALISATSNGYKAIVQLLLTRKPNLNIQRSTDKRTALMIASILGYDQIVNLLVQYNASVSLKDKNGKTAYDLAGTLLIKQILQELED